MKCQILFLGKNMKMFKLSAETKFNIQHFEIFFLFSQKTKTCFFFFFFFFFFLLFFFFFFFFFLGGGGGGAAGGRYQLVIACGISPESEKKVEVH